jgi:hypothetical protein
VVGTLTTHYERCPAGERLKLARLRLRALRNEPAEVWDGRTSRQDASVSIRAHQSSCFPTVAADNRVEAADPNSHQPCHVDPPPYSMQQVLRMLTYQPSRPPPRGSTQIVGRWVLRLSVARLISRIIGWAYRFERCSMLRSMRGRHG